MVPLILPGVTELVSGQIDIVPITTLLGTDMNMLWLYALDEILISGSHDVSNYAGGSMGCNRFINEIADYYNRLLADENEAFIHPVEHRHYTPVAAAFYNNYDVVVECIHCVYGLMLIRLSKMVSINPTIREHDPAVTYVERLESYAVVLYLFRSVTERLTHGIPMH